MPSFTLAETIQNFDSHNTKLRIMDICFLLVEYYVITLKTNDYELQLLGS
jgi:hypothetical protein